LCPHPNPPLGPENDGPGRAETFWQTMSVKADVSRETAVDTGQRGLAAGQGQSLTLRRSPGPSRVVTPVMLMPQPAWHGLVHSGTTRLHPGETRTSGITPNHS
jgi:hypothetical protein